MKVSNPLTIIAIFSGTAEAFATAALIALPLEIQSLFIYFVMLFPLIIVVTFFLILILKPHVLYAPSDFDNQQHFLDLNNLRKSVEEISEKSIKEASENNQPLDPRKMSKTIADSTIDKLEDTIKDRIYQYLKEHSNEAFTSAGLAHVFSISRINMLTYLQKLESQNLVNKGKDGDSAVWQVKK
ncbi:hypothetical protein DFP75_101598 [Marinomonas alcarazii]|uniref:Uncharacterized protein n=1 Tax=Marinomonas alcarazii TaxID=491949 RepID=A0A318V9G6_9GAMM|nr:ArsR family transcriptional regulator [Marinomonas alcarazii]PYF84560.1 hypothetical protein DFP75_101598 [Marinomonas alcarazii]